MKWFWVKFLKETGGDLVVTWNRVLGALGNGPADFVFRNG